MNYLKEKYSEEHIYVSYHSIYLSHLSWLIIQIFIKLPRPNHLLSLSFHTLGKTAHPHTTTTTPHSRHSALFILPHLQQ